MQCALKLGTDVRESSAQESAARFDEVVATVTDVVTDRGFVFLMTHGEYKRDIFLTFMVLKKRFPDWEIKPQDLVTCRIRDKLNGKRPCVVRVREISRPTESPA